MTVRFLLISGGGSMIGCFAHFHQRAGGSMTREQLIVDLKRFMIKELKLKRAEDQIKEDAALFGPDGLGIDSLDGIQLGVAAEARYNVRIPIDTDEGKQALSSLNALADYIFKFGPTEG